MSNETPTPTDHAELRWLAEKWRLSVDQAYGRLLSEYMQGHTQAETDCANELDLLLSPAFEELDRLRAELAEMTRRMINLAERKAAVAQMVEALEEARHYVAVYGNGGRPNELLDQMRDALDAVKGIQR
jgi:hypothetical protein